MLSPNSAPFLVESMLTTLFGNACDLTREKGDKSKENDLSIMNQEHLNFFLPRLARGSSWQAFEGKKR